MPKTSTLSARSLIWSSFKFHLRLNLAVALAVLACTAVFTGALVVGDSVKASMRRLTLERLGPIDQVLVGQRFFRQDLVNELRAAPNFEQHFANALPAVLVSGNVTQPDSEARAGGVNVWGCAPDFFKWLDPSLSNKLPGGDEVLINQSLAAELNAQVGDDLLIRAQLPSDIPGDSPLGRKLDHIESRRVTITGIVPSEGLGRIDLHPDQRAALNLFLPLETLQRELEQPGQVNLVLVTGHFADQPSGQDADTFLEQALAPTLADYGLKTTERGAGASRYFHLETDQMLLSPALQQDLTRIYADREPLALFTYLANTIADKRTGNSLPYSTVTAASNFGSPQLGPVDAEDGTAITSLADDEILLNRWAADDLSAQPGDAITLTYFEPESTHGVVREKSVEFRLKAVVPLAGALADPQLTPALPGVTDQLQMSNWDPPFEYHQDRVRDKDEDYWDDHKATPKAFVSLAAGKQLFGSRFGDTTGLRFAAKEGEDLAAFQARIRLAPARHGFAFRPMKRLGLEASQGTTPFSLLFLGFSMFLMVAALLLVALLFRLGVERRTQEIGILATVGFSPRRIRQTYLAEAALVAIVGGLLGIAAGLGYAWLMIWGLTHWWVKAISAPFLHFEVTAPSLILGLICGLVTSLIAIAIGFRAMSKYSLRQMLSQPDSAGPISKSKARLGLAATALFALAAVATAALGTQLGGEAQAGAFFGAGALALLAGMSWLWQAVRGKSGVFRIGPGSQGLLRLVGKNVSRNATRNMLTVGLVASACFLILAISAFHLSPGQAGPDRASGNGGFSLLAKTDQPVFQDINGEDAKSALGMSDADSGTLGHARVFSFRVQPGDDASCLNLYQATQPRVLAVPPELAAEADGRFAWAGSAAATQAEKQNPWKLLAAHDSASNASPNSNNGPGPNDGPSAGAAPNGSASASQATLDQRPIPVVLDQNTAMYSLHLWTGVGSEFDLPRPGDTPLRLKVVGLLKNSVLQGSILMSERDFLRSFPLVSGYKFFLVETQPAGGTRPGGDANAGPSADQVSLALESSLADYGMDVRQTGQVLQEFLAIQNTYLATFQTVGGLGLLLGTLGLAAVQLRNVVERRQELAILQAIGFHKGRIARLILGESLFLLLLGLLLGGASAAVALFPHLTSGSAALPYKQLGGLLLAIVGCGWLGGLLAVRTALKTPVLVALRRE